MLILGGDHEPHVKLFFTPTIPLQQTWQQVNVSVMLKLWKQIFQILVVSDVNCKRPSPSAVTTMKVSEIYLLGFQFIYIYITVEVLSLQSCSIIFVPLSKTLDPRLSHG